MRGARTPLMLALLSVLLLLAAFALFLWSVDPPHPHGGAILPGAVAATIVAAAVAVLGLVRQRRFSARKSWFVMMVAVLGCSALMLVPLMLYVIGAYRVWICNEKMKNLAMALSMYSQDHGALPPGDQWCDALASYGHGMERWWFTCPERPDLQCGYALNAALSGVSLEEIPEPVSTVLLFESDAGWNACGGRELLPERPRHGKRDMYAEALVSTRLSDRTAVTEGTADIFWDPMAAGEAGSPLPANE